MFTVVVVIGCARKKDDSVVRRDSVASRVDSVKREIPHTPDYDLFAVNGDVEYIVKERFGDMSGRELIQGDSIIFNDKGWMTGKVSWSGSGYKRGVYSDIRLFYTDEGEFERGEDVAGGVVAKILIERNDSLQLVKLGRIGSGGGDDEMNYTESWEWRGSVPSRYELSGWEWMTSRRYKYSGENLYPQSCLHQEETEEGRLSDSKTYRYTKFDSSGNWIERSVEVEETVRDYDVESGKIIEVGEPKRYRYLERRRIGYRGM